MERLNETAQDWVPHVRRLRPDLAWEDVVRIINGPLPEARRWTQSRLLRAVKAYVRDGFLSAEVLARAGRRENRRPPARHRCCDQGGRIPTSRLRRSAPGWKRCASARPAGGQAGSLRR